METNSNGNGSNVDLKAMMGQSQQKMQESLAIQIEMQNMSSEMNSKSTVAKMSFDTEQAAIARLSAVGEAVSKLTDQQSAQIAQ